VAGIVGAGGNVGAVLAGLLFKTDGISWPQALIVLGVLVMVSASLALLVRFAPAELDQHVPARLAMAPSLAGGD
jgi:NNP family nitrate/nitrite transporter-like MFS transporter